MWLGSSLKFSPYIFFLGFPRHQNFGRRVKVAFPSPKYWHKGLLAVGLSCFYFENFFSEVAKLEWQIFQDKKVASFDTNTYTLTFTRTHAHTHNLDFSVNCGAHPPLSTASLFEFDSQQVLLCLLLCSVVLVTVVLLTQQLYFRFKF